jgi:hypothetical protein
MNDLLRYRAAQAGSQVGTMAGKAVPFAQQAMPLAQNAGTTMRHSAGGAMSKTTPVVEAARSWAAPQLEQSAHAITEIIAPMISSALLNAAHAIEVPKQPKPRGNRALMAGAVVLTAAAGAATAAAVRMRRNAGGNGAMTAATEAVPGETGPPPPDPDLDGRSRIV